MSANLRFIAHAAQRNANELASHGVSDGSSQRRLPDARRTDKAKNRRLAVRLQFENGKILQNAFLDLLEIVMIPIENILGLDECRSSPSSGRSRAASPASPDKFG